MGKENKSETEKSIARIRDLLKFPKPLSKEMNPCGEISLNSFEAFSIKPLDKEKNENNPTVKPNFKLR